jgi:gliding motility-associated-like protein
MLASFARFLLPFGLLLTAFCSQAQDVSGFWLGVATPTDPSGAAYNYTTTLYQAGNALGGTAQTALPKTTFGAPVYLRGAVSGNRITFREADVAGSLNNSTCYWDVSLTYDPTNESLKGTYKNIQNPPYCSYKETGTIEIYRVRLKSGTRYCTGQPARLEATGVNLRWYDSADLKKLLATGNTFPTSFSANTTLYVTQTIGSLESPPVPFRIEVSAPRIDQVMVTPADCGEGNGTMTIRASGGNNLSYSLDGRSFGVSPQFLSQSPGSYTAIVRDAYGCRAEYGADIPSGCKEIVYLPSAFSPNGDGQNETFVLQHPFSSLNVLRFQVFNRWGGVVYARDAFTARSGDSLWDGLSIPNEHRFGDYAYVLEVAFGSGQQHTYRGLVTVIK